MIETAMELSSCQNSNKPTIAMELSSHCESDSDSPMTMFQTRGLQREGPQTTSLKGSFPSFVDDKVMDVVSMNSVGHCMYEPAPVLKLNLFVTPDPSHTCT